MKSIRFSLLAVLVVFTMGAIAQEETASKFYVKVYGGYGLLSPGSYRLEAYTSTDTDPDGSLSVSKKGLGAGIRAGGGIGIIVSDFLNIGIDAEYLSGAKLKSKSEYRSGVYSSSSETEISYTSISIIPHAIFKAISKPDYMVYNKLGILINLPFDLENKSYDTSSNTAASYTGGSNTTSTYKIKMGAGLNVALGVQVRVSEKLRAFGEIFGNYLVLSPETQTSITTTVNRNGGVVTTNNGTRIVTYIKDGDLSYSNTSVPNDKGGYDTVDKYDESVTRNRFNMNSIGLNVGITFRF